MSERKTVRCKFRCDEVTKQKGWSTGSPFLYSAKFSAVHDGSPENKAFWEATPAGSLSVSTVKADVFEVGKEYYIDLTDSTPVEAAPST